MLTGLYDAGGAAVGSRTDAAFVTARPPRSPARRPPCFLLAAAPSSDDGGAALGLPARADVDANCYRAQFRGAGPNLGSAMKIEVPGGVMDSLDRFGAI
ncbi:MAG: hypothetical protein JWQ46_1674 [Phenylobacterium sp.]|nr:hypothetical protein [Phenylobacterium sp.]